MGAGRGVLIYVRRGRQWGRWVATRATTTSSTSSRTTQFPHSIHLGHVLVVIFCFVVVVVVVGFGSTVAVVHSEPNAGGEVLGVREVDYKVVQGEVV